MHPTLISRFPRLGALYLRSKTTKSDNYFAIYDKPTLFESTEKQFIAWEALLQALDPDSFETFLRKAAGRVAARAKSPDRGWSQLVDCFNEVRGYRYAVDIGYSRARLVDEQSVPLPDVEASKPDDAKCLLEVKTIQESDEELQMRGHIQSAESGLPKRLTLTIQNKYSEAISQIANHPWAPEARKICYLIINLDLATVLAGENKDFLETFIKKLERNDVEIQYISQYWPPDP
jgi:hypothetical protein